jgi:recombination associated protein RdgC
MLMALLENIERTVFLGEEFLMWLWFRSETDPQVDLSEPLVAVRVEMGDSLTLRGPEEADAALVSVRGERAAASSEARAAAREGKKLCKCKARFRQGDQIWPFALNADTLGVSGLRLPVPRGVPMPDGLIMRGEKLEEFIQHFYAVFEVFLDQRLREKKWKALEAAMRVWILGEGKEA